MDAAATEERARAPGWIELEATTAAMVAAGKTYEPVIYEGAGHGFMRSGEGPEASEANRQGREDAWNRWNKLLAGLSEDAD